MGPHIVDRNAYCMQSSVPTINIIVPIWGQRHVTRFLDFVAPSWLATGNLPALTARSKVRVIIATCELDTLQIKRSAVLQQIGKFAEVIYLAIDDLMCTTHMPVTLTLAFQRALTFASSIEMPASCILLNGDFLLSDGSFRSIASVLAEGKRLILAPSFRVSEQQVVPLLRRANAEEGHITRSSRELVSIGLASLHHTITACFMDQLLIHSAMPHQLYWRVDGNTLTSRAWCLFTLAVVIDHAPPPPQAYCDYGMAELLVPDCEPYIFADSDDFLAVELGEPTQEVDFVRAGRPQTRRIAKQLSGWTTPFHRAQARTPIVFHSQDVPTGIDKVHKIAEEVVDDILRNCKPALPVLNHPIWVDGLYAWRIARADQDIFDDPIELAGQTRELDLASQNGLDPAVSLGWRGTVRRILVGRPNARQFWQPFSRLVRNMERIEQSARRSGYHLITSRDRGVGGVNIGLWGNNKLKQPRSWYVEVADLSHPGRVRGEISRLLKASRVGDRVSIIVHRNDGITIAPIEIAGLLAELYQGFQFESEQIIASKADVRARTAYGNLSDTIGNGWNWKILLALAHAGCALALLLLSRLIELIRPQKEVLLGEIVIVSGIIASRSAPSCADSDNLAMAP